MAHLGSRCTRDKSVPQKAKAPRQEGLAPGRLAGGPLPPHRLRVAAEGRYVCRTVVAPAAALEVSAAPVGATCVPHTHTTSPLALLYGVRDNFPPQECRLACETAVANR